MSLSDASHTLNIEGHGSLANMHTEGNNYELTVQCVLHRVLHVMGCGRHGMGGAGSRREGPREGLGRPPQIGSVGRGLALGKGKGHGRRWARTRVTATGTYSESRSRSMNYN